MTRGNGLMAAWIALTLVPSIASAVTPAELRCGELGASCACSEPLDFVNSSIPSSYDFPDSEGVGAKECNGGTAFQVDSGAQSMVPAATTGLVGPASVLQITMYHNAYINDQNRTFTNGTWCQRHYFRYGPGYANGSNNPSGVKGPRNEKPDFGDHPGMETAWDGAGQLGWAPGYWHPKACPSVPCTSAGSTFGPDLPHSGTSVTRADCANSWCRFEMCFDHNENGSQKLRERGRIVQLSNGDTDLVNKLLDGASPSAAAGDFVHLFKTFIESPGAWANGEHVWVSHAMVAIKQPADPSFWIGPAREITNDSGASSSPTSPPPATAPPAPVLLP